MTDIETPAFDTLQREVDNMMADQTQPPQPGDHRMEVLTAIREGRTTGPQRDGEHILTLASMGFDIETVADAIDKTVEETEAIAADECYRIADRMERAEEAREE